MRLQPARELTEKEWDAQLFSSRDGLATMLGWKLRYHTLRSKGSTSGFPDRIIVRERVIAAELKSSSGKPSDVQIEWLDGLAAAGIETYLWTPNDLDEVSRVLASRGPFDAPSGSLKSADSWWQPRSLWIPGAGRADTVAGRQESLLA